jgi:hypothetical protein
MMIDAHRKEHRDKEYHVCQSLKTKSFGARRSGSMAVRIYDVYRVDSDAMADCVRRMTSAPRASVCVTRTQIAPKKMSAGKQSERESGWESQTERD